jgi:hypothetical protein
MDTTLDPGDAARLSFAADKLTVVVNLTPDQTVEPASRVCWSFLGR